MDSLILTFNKEQLKLYNELLVADTVTLNFNTTIPNISEYSFDIIKIEIPSIQAELSSLLKHQNQTSMFSSSLTQDQIQKLIPVYYEALISLGKIKARIGKESLIVSSKINEIEKHIAEINQRYADFLPYKAALSKNSKYASIINQTDEEFKANIQKANEYRKELLLYFDSMLNLCELISDFSIKSSRASDEPKFENFNTYDFFLSIDSLIEQLKILIK